MTLADADFSPGDMKVQNHILEIYCNEEIINVTYADGFHNRQRTN